MTVAELIAFLDKVEPNAPVLLGGDAYENIDDSPIWRIVVEFGEDGQSVILRK